MVKLFFFASLPMGIQITSAGIRIARVCFLFVCGIYPAAPVFIWRHDLYTLV